MVTQETVAFIGLGLMGTPMASRLLSAGKTVVVWNRTKTKADPLIAKGARWSETVRDAVTSSSVTISMLSTPDVVDGIAADVRSALSPNGIHIDCSTVSPELTK